MWFTIIIFIVSFLLWFITNFIITTLFGNYFVVFRRIMEEFYVPEGFIILASFLPNIVLVGFYFMTTKLQKNNTFKCWEGWKGFRKNFKSINETYLHDKEQVIYAVSPHGIHGEAVILYFVLNELYEKVEVIASSLLFYIPIIREFAYLSGSVPANTSVIGKVLDDKKSILLIPEGLRGALHPNSDFAVLKGIPDECDPRKGFIKTAISSSNHKTIKIVPIYMEGVEEMYTTYHLFPWLQKIILRNYYYPWFMLNFGYYGSFWPKDVPIVVKFGKSVPLIDKNGNIREVDDVFNEFIKNITEAKQSQ